MSRACEQHVMIHTSFARLNATVQLPTLVPNDTSGNAQPYVQQYFYTGVVTALRHGASSALR
jgi:hypothetical protein